MLSDLIDNLNGAWFTPEQIWNAMMLFISNFAAETPSQFSPEGWAKVRTLFFDLSVPISAVLVNLFFFIGYFKVISNLKQNMTLEVSMPALL